MAEPTPPTPFPDRLTIRRVANGWIIELGRGNDEFVHVAATPDDLANHVRKWAKAQGMS
jgi:hypothetical protein